MMPGRRRRLRLASPFRPTVTVFLVLAVLVAAGCGDDEQPEAQPAPDVTAFTTGDFGELPRPPRSEPAGERSERNGVVARSFFVRNMTPEEVLAFYRDTFGANDIQVISPPEPFGPDNWRGTWLVDDRELLVSATPAPTAEGEKVDGSDLSTQFSLELSPPGGHDPDEGTDGAEDSP